MLGIIGAMDTEVNGLKERLEQPVTETAAGIAFVRGFLEGTAVCVAQCSPGKVNAALCAQRMIDAYRPAAIVNLGVGCSLNKTVVIGDTVVAETVCQYDFDTSAIDGVKGLVLDGMTALPADGTLSDALAAAAAATGARVHRGGIATGDTFIASDALKERIARECGALCGEMEGGAIGQVCYVNRVPFAVLRTISDGGDAAAQLDYPSFKKIAAESSAAILLRYLKDRA